jgi:hypothetical protein
VHIPKSQWENKWQLRTRGYFSGQKSTQSWRQELGQGRLKWTPYDYAHLLEETKELCPGRCHLPPHTKFLPLHPRPAIAEPTHHHSPNQRGTWTQTCSKAWLETRHCQVMALPENCCSTSLFTTVYKRLTEEGQGIDWLAACKKWKLLPGRLARGLPLNDAAGCCCCCWLFVCLWV